MTLIELIRETASESKGLVFADWFTVDIPGVLRALYMIVLQTSPEAASPILHRLTPGLDPEPPDGSKNTKRGCHELVQVICVPTFSRTCGLGESLSFVDRPGQNSGLLSYQCLERPPCATSCSRASGRLVKLTEYDISLDR